MNLTDDQQEFYDERLAICAESADMTEADAERVAKDRLRRYRQEQLVMPWDRMIKRRV